MPNNENGLIVIDTPEGIAAYRLLAIKSALKLETKGMQMSRGVRASVAARDELTKAGKQAPRGKAKLLKAFETHLREIGVLVDSVIARPGNLYLSVYDPLGHEWISTHKGAFVMSLKDANTRLAVVKEKHPDAMLMVMG